MRDQPRAVSGAVAVQRERPYVSGLVSTCSRCVSFWYLAETLPIGDFLGDLAAATGDLGA